MRKNFMLSLAAMATLPMAGLADTAWQVSPVSAWTCEPGTTLELSTPENISGLGAGISQNVTLPKGKYQLVVNTLTNATLKIVVDGTEYLPNEWFEIDGTKSVMLNLAADKKDAPFSVTGMHFVLDFTFSGVDVSAALTAATADLTAKDPSNDSWTAQLWSDVENLETAIDNIIDDTEPGWDIEKGKATFDVYMQYELYNYGNAETPSKLENAIAAVQDAASIIKNVNTWMTDLNTTLNASANKLAKAAYSDIVEDFVEELNEVLTTCEAAYKDANTPAPKYSDVEDEYKQTVDDLLLSIPAYHTASSKLTACEKSYQTKLVNFETNIVPVEVYGELLNKAKAALLTKYAPVVEKLNDFAHLTEKDDFIGFHAVATGYTDACTTANSGMSAVYNLYYNHATKSYFKVLQGHFAVVDDFNDRIDAVEATNEAYKQAFGGNGVVSDVDITAAKTVVNNIKTAVNDAMKNIDDTKSYNGLVVDYAADQTDAESKISDLETTIGSAGDWAANYNSLQTHLNAVNQALADANAAVQAMNAEGYSAWDKWNHYANSVVTTDGFISIKEKIAAIENDIAGKKSNPSGFDASYTASKISAIDAIKDNDILGASGYQSMAQDALDAYNDIQDFLSDWREEYDRVRAFITNPAVKVVGSSPATTYGAEMNAVQTRINTVSDALAAALLSNGAVHYNDITAIVITGTPSTADFTPEQYQIDKNTYELPQAIKDAKAQAVYVKDYAAEVYALLADPTEGALTKYAVTLANQAKYGNRYYGSIWSQSGNADTKTANGLKAYFDAITGIQSDGTYDYTGFSEYDDITASNADFDDVKAFLTKIDAAFTQLATVKQGLVDLDERAEQIAQDVQDNLDAYNEYVVYYNGGTHPVTGETITSYSAQADAISAQKLGDNPDTGIAAEYLAITALADEYYAALIIARDAETVKANATGEKGFDAQKAAIENRLDQFGTTVTASNDNWSAYKKLYNHSNSLFKKNLITPGGAAGNIANKAYLSINTIDNSGHKWYAGIAQQLSKDIATLEAEIQTYYANVECKIKYDEVAASINELVDKVNACIANCKLNDDNYDLLGKQYTSVCGVYNTVYNFINDKDKSSKKDEWLGKVDAEKENIDTNKDNIETAFGKGLLATDYNTYKDNYSTYEKNINDIKGKWLGDEDGYYAKVMADNSKMHTDFLDAYTKANERYDEVTKSLNKFLALSIDKNIVATALEALYTVKAALDVTKTDEGEKYYENLVANNAITPENIQNGIYPAVFTDSYLNAANQALTDIEAKYANATTQLNAAAKTEFKGYVDAAETAINEAYNEIKAAGYYDIQYKDPATGLLVYLYDDKFKAIKASLKDEQDLLSDPELALKYTDHIETVEALHIDTETTKSDLYLVKESVAEYAYDIWSADWTGLNTDMDTWAKDKVYGKYADGTFDGTNYKTDFDAAYSTLTETVGELKDGSASLYDVMGDIKTAYDTFKADPTYNNFKGLIQNHDASEADYNKFFTDAKINATARIEAVRQNIATAEDYAKKFAVSTSIDAAKTALDYFDVTLPTIRENDGVHLQDLTDKLTAAETAAKDLCAKMNNDEKTFIAAQIERLKGDVINAKVEDVEAYNVKITQYTNDLNALAMDEVAGTTQDGLLALQDAVANDRTTLTGFDAQAVKEKLTEELAQNAAVYSKATEDYATLFPFQQDDLRTVNVTTDELAGKVESNFENNTLIFNAEKLEAAIQGETSALEVYNLRVQAAKEVKATHEAAVERLENELESIDAQYSALNEKLMGYSEEVQELFLGFAPYYEANKASETERLAAVPANGDELLDGDSALKFNNTNSGSAVPPVTRAAATVTPPLQTLPTYVTTFEEYFAYVDKYCSNKEVYVRMDKFYTEVFSTVDFNVTGGYIYDEATLTAEQSDIDDAYNALDTYRQDAFRYGIVSADIDGKAYTKINDAGVEVRDPKTVDFVTECAAMFDKIIELAGRVEQLKSDIAVNTFFMGDVDHDKVVDVNDFATLKLHLLGEYELDAVMKTAADVNGDGKVNIGDLTRLVGMILGTATPATPVRVAMPYATSNDALSVVVEGEGVHQRIGIMLDAQQFYAGCQMDILLPEGVTLVGESLGEMAAALSLSSNDLENGCHRIILSSIEGNAMTTGNGAMIWLDVEVDHNYSGEGIALSNVLFANAAGRTFELSVANNETTGLSNVSMTQEVKEKIYNVGGILMDSLKRGVNIIRGNDGTSKKVLK